ncbi:MULTISPECIES: hypothetical protein [Flavobacteriaceae]|uniref:hypothetical protein n=1 Tax=Flavobacteriaceae TaxID=49546 RepID=UPI0014919A45|nr:MULTISPECIES: hypothetical protein [Allomuricauda]MDC6364652.1 hypothetical protein [Muricauda sp. AC10]
MRTTIFIIAFFSLTLVRVNAQTDQSEVALAEVETETVATVQKSDYQLKLEEKEAKRTVKALKKKNKQERSVLKLKNTQRTDGIKLEKLNTRHLASQKNLSDVKREKLELKIAKLEMKMARDKAKLKKLEDKLLL